MLGNFSASHDSDKNDNPAGGTSTGIGIMVKWQNGPLGKIGSPDRKEPNGAFVETVIAVAKNRLEYYQKENRGKFYCGENAVAIEYLTKAMLVLQGRTQRRQMAGVEGTHDLAKGDGKVEEMEDDKKAGQAAASNDEANKAEEKTGDQAQTEAPAADKKEADGGGKADAPPAK